MADNLPTTIENSLIDLLFNNVSFSITYPVKCALMTANGNDDTPGTEVTGGSYARQSMVMNDADAGGTANNTEVNFTGMPSCTVVGIELYDSAATPLRLAYGPLTTSRTVTAGDTVQFAAGSVVFTLS